MIKMTLGQAAQLLGLNQVRAQRTTTHTYQLAVPHGSPEFHFDIETPASDTNDLQFQGIAIDTRQLMPGNLFVALKGNHVDGHDFLEEAKRKGAACALVSRPLDHELPQLIVKDCIL